MAGHHAAVLEGGAQRGEVVAQPAAQRIVAHQSVGEQEHVPGHRQLALERRGVERRHQQSSRGELGGIDGAHAQRRVVGGGEVRRDRLPPAIAPIEQSLRSDVFEQHEPGLVIDAADRRDAHSGALEQLGGALEAERGSAQLGRVVGDDRALAGAGNPVVAPQGNVARERLDRDRSARRETSRSTQPATQIGMLDSALRHLTGRFSPRNLPVRNRAPSEDGLPWKKNCNGCSKVSARR